jgi:hypothetical protein
MNEQFWFSFEADLQKIADSLTKKGGVKQNEKVYERIGRIKQKDPSIQRYFDLEVKDDVDIKIKKRDTQPLQEKKRTVIPILRLRIFMMK